MTKSEFAGFYAYGRAKIERRADVHAVCLRGCAGGRAGCTIHDDWDALGMRASVSNSVSFDRVHLPETTLRGGVPVRSAVCCIEHNLAKGLFHASTSVAVAVAAHDAAIWRPRGRVVHRSMRLVTSRTTLCAIWRLVRRYVGFGTHMLEEPATTTELPARAADFGPAAVSAAAGLMATIYELHADGSTPTQVSFQ